MTQSLNILLQGLETTSSIPNLDIAHLCFDSREAKKGSLFFALKGTTTDGHNYLNQVAASGCEVALVEEVQEGVNLTQIQVKDTHLALSYCAETFYNKPSSKLTLVGITGTNGKTTTTTLLFDLFKGLGYDCGLISTVVNKINDEAIPSTHTTPNPIALAELMSRMVEAGCTHAFMEVSSHAIHQKRIAALDFDVAIFSNISHDHLDYHKTFQEYIQAKKAFFDQLKPEAAALTNIDDKNGMVMLQNTKAKKYTYALKSPADFKTKILENQISGLVLHLENTEVWTRLIGKFNAYNLLAVYAVSQILGEDKLEVMTAISNLQSVDGRFQQFKSDSGISCIVDYAHTPDALENVLDTIQNFTGDNHIITVVGCGGDRDKTKRPEMAKIAAKMSNQVILTSDNPRTENPESILDDMEAGLDPVMAAKSLRISDRDQAIKTAAMLSQPNSIVLIAGKGHEKYQDIQGTKHPFDDFAKAKEHFIKLKK